MSASAPQLICNIADLRNALSGASVALVPTMGALHDGHLSLVRRARDWAEIVVVSIYVNPLQFGQNEDFADYPRDLAADCRQLHGLADIVFAPENLYPAEQTVRIALPPLAEELCGQYRPGFFSGVAVAVCKLFNCVQPQTAIFGQKDFQQLQIIRLLTAQLNFPVRIVGAPIVREADGLAMSSRNVYLSGAERAKAVLLPQTLRDVAAAVQDGESPTIVAAAAAESLRQSGFVVDYLQARDIETLGAPMRGQKIVILAAAYLGKTRLIDNIECEYRAE